MARRMVLLLAAFQLLGVLTCFVSALQQGSKQTTEHLNHEERRILQATVGVVDEFILIDSALDKTLMSIQNGQIINIATLNTFRFNIQANVTGNVKSIKFGHNGRSQFHVDNGPTFAFCGHEGTNFFRCDVLDVGEHTVTATPYSEKNLRGDEGIQQQVTFTITNNNVPTAPSEAPANSPSSCMIPKVDPNWDRIPPEYPIDASETQGTMLGTNIFISGGFVNGFNNVTNHSYARDISVAGSSWSRMEDMPVTIGITHAAVVAIGMKLYMCGGYAGIRPGRHVANCFVYDQSKAPGTGQWSTFTNLPNGGSAGAGMIYDSATRMLYYAGGARRLKQDSIDATDVTSMWKISIDTPSSGWVLSKPFPYKANHLSAVTTKIINGQERHFFVGGQKGENELDGNVGDMFEFIPSTETWIRRASLPSNRSHTTVSTRAIGCGFIMAGGTLNSLTALKKRTAEILYYDVPTNRWTTIGNIPIPGATPPVFLDDNGFIYFVSNRRTSRSRIVV